MRRPLIAAIALAGVWLDPGDAVAATFKEATVIPQFDVSVPFPIFSDGDLLTPFTASLPFNRTDGGNRIIYMEGLVEHDDDKRLRAVAGKTETYGNVILYMNSEGGNFEAGLALGDAISDLHLLTFVGPGARCLSACAFAFLGGQAQISANGRATPTRQLHTEGLLAFHAPTLDKAIPTALLADPTAATFLAQELSRPTLANIAEIQSRAGRWILSPYMLAAIFRHLGADEFVPIDSLYEAMQNEIAILGPPLAPVAGWGAVEALQACSFTLGHSLWSERIDLDIPAYGGGSQGWMPGAAFFRTVLADRSLAVAETVAGPVITWTTEAGRMGTVTCTVRQGAEGLMVELAGPGLFAFAPIVEYLKKVGPFPVSRLGLLGFGIPWTAIGAADLYIEDPEGLWAGVPDDLLTVATAYEPCTAGSQVWPTICRFPTLRRAIGVMTVLSDRLGARQNYRDIWNQNLVLLCRPQSLPAGDTEAEMFAGYCALMVTQDLTRIALEALTKTP